MDLKETIMGKEQALAAQDRAFQGGPITLVLIIKHLSGLATRAMKQLYEYVAKINLKSIMGEDITKSPISFAPCSSASHLVQ